MIDSITSNSYNNKSRNKNYLTNHITGNKTNILTERDKNKKNAYNMINKNIMLQTQTVYFQNKKKLKTYQIGNEKKNKDKKIQSSDNYTKKDNVNLGNNKFKTYLDIKFNLYQKTRNNVINELKKSIGLNAFTMSQLNSNKFHRKNYSSSKSKNNEKIINNNKNSKNNYSKIPNDKININKYS